MIFPTEDAGDFITELKVSPTFKAPNAVGISVDPTRLAMSFQQLMQQLGTALSSGLAIPGGYEVDQIEVPLEITAEGSVGILGSGGSLGGTAGLSVVLRRPAPATKP